MMALVLGRWQRAPRLGDNWKHGVCFTRVTIDACGKLLGWENDTSQRGDAGSHLRQMRVIWRQNCGEAVCTYHERECDRRLQTL